MENDTIDCQRPEQKAQECEFWCRQNDRGHCEEYKRKKVSILRPPDWGPNGFPKMGHLLYDSRIKKNRSEWEGGLLGGSRLGGGHIWGKVEGWRLNW